MIIEMAVGGLPWKNLTEMEAIGVLKKECKTTKQKCLFGGCPKEYLDIFPILDKGKFFDVPDYQAIYELLEKAMISTKATEYPYDWEKVKFFH